MSYDVLVVNDPATYLLKINLPLSYITSAHIQSLRTSLYCNLIRGHYKYAVGS